MKVDSAEARALVGLLNRWDPHLTIDLHTTNGSYHGYHLTYSPTLNPNADDRLIQFEREMLLPAVRAALLKNYSFRSYYYGNFSPEGSGGRQTSRVDPSSPGNVTWRTFDHRPRFGNNYLGLRNRLAVLSEAYSYLDFKRRIDVTAGFTLELLRATVDNGAAILRLTAEADHSLVDVTSARQPRELGVSFDVRPAPSPIEILVGDVARARNPRSGRDMLQMTDKAVPVRMKEYGTFAATRTLSVPAGWVIPHDDAEAPRMGESLARLKIHGIRIDRVVSAVQLAVERFMIQSVTRADRPFQNRRETRLVGRQEVARVSVPAGSLFVTARQPLARLAFYLLEAESDDGLVNWGVMDEGLAPGRVYPVYRVTDASTLAARGESRD
jgi:hypothetical protein